MSWYKTKHWEVESTSQYEVVFFLRNNSNIKLVCPIQWSLTGHTPLRHAIYDKMKFLIESVYDDLVKEDMPFLISSVRLVASRMYYRQSSKYKTDESE